MNVPTDKYPAEGSCNENVLFSSLGAFWTKVFQDRAALKGLTFAQAEEICQSYSELIAAVDSYSAEHVKIFKPVKWFPVFIKQSQLNSSILRFGTTVKFGDTVESEEYRFGSAAPQENSVYVIDLPENLHSVSLLANRVIAPDFVLVNNVDVQVKGSQLYFYGNPFELKNVNSAALIDPAGNPEYFTNPLTGQQIPDRIMLLWAYNAKLRGSSLSYNIGYLFGVNVPPSSRIKSILEALVKFNTGAGVGRLKKLCGAFLDIKPVVEDTETVLEVRNIGTHNIVVTDRHTYRFDSYYSLNSNVIPGNTVSSGDILVDAVEYYDAVTFKNWWRTRMTPKIASGEKSPSFTVPPYMFVGNIKFGLTFKNSMELVTRDSAGNVTFPVDGRPEDVQAFQAHINMPDNKEKVCEALGGLPVSSMRVINPLDFLFTHLFQTSTALVKINFKTVEQLGLFTEIFTVFKKCLPAHVYCLFFFDVTLPGDSYKNSAVLDGADSSGVVVTSEYSAPLALNGDDDAVEPGEKAVTVNSITVTRPAAPQSDGLACNSRSMFPSNAFVSDRIIVRPIPPGITTRDYVLIDLTKDQHADLI